MIKLLVNPYENANWNNQYKANFHTHANEWGENHSELNPHETIDLYHEHGYRILAITEHLVFVWPWEDYDRNPQELDMLPIKGAEIFNNLHQVLCLFESITKTTDKSVENVYDAYDEMWENRASGIIAHPRYPLYIGKYDLEWYLETYARYPFFFGIEVFNPKYDSAEKWWDEILSHLMPYRPVWGVSGHDTHQIATEFDTNHTFVLADDLTEKSVRYAMESGKMYFCNGDLPRDVVINEICVDEDRGQISIHADNGQEVEWITNNSQVIATGDTFSYRDSEDLKDYVRARVIGENNNAYTQPFGFIHRI